MSFLTYLKCIAAGVLATGASAVLCMIAVIIYGLYAFRTEANGAAVGWDPISMFRYSLVPWFVVAVVFSAGFAWEYRRAARKSQRHPPRRTV